MTTTHGVSNLLTVGIEKELMISHPGTISCRRNNPS